MSIRTRTTIGIVVAVAWMGVAAVWAVQRFESDIEERAALALETVGIVDVQLRVEGRDIIVEDVGTVPAETVLAVVGSLEGVRRVDFESVQAGQASPDNPTATTVPGADQTTTTPPPSTTTTSLPQAAPQASLVATLDGPDFLLSGVVPSQEIADELLAAANIAYAPFVESDLIVSEDVSAPPWLAGARFGLSLLPMITDGTIRVEGDRVELTGRSPNGEYLALFEGAVSQAFGIDDIENNVAITNLTPPVFKARMDDGILTLTGTLPSEDIRQLLVGAAVATYGESAVVNELDLGEDLYTSFWMFTMPGVFQLLQPFPAYEFQVVDGVTSGAFRGGASFAFGSAELTPELRQVLDIGVAVLSRDFSLGTRVEGHTDSVGAEGFNQGLSEARAQAAVDYLIASGIAPERLKALGFGELRPSASNDTVEGRRQNRRVEFIFGPVAEIAAGP